VLQIVEPVMHGLHWPDAVLSYVVVASLEARWRRHVSPSATRKGPSPGWRRASRNKTPPSFDVKSNQTWDPVRSDPRFQKLLRRMNLE